MAQPRAVKFCTQVGYIKRIESHPQKGLGYGHVTDLNS